MVEEVIEGRYTPVRSILEEQLTNWYGVGNFKILQPPDDYGKWKVEVPEKLSYSQKVDLHKSFFYHHKRLQYKAGTADGGAQQDAA